MERLAAESFGGLVEELDYAEGEGDLREEDALSHTLQCGEVSQHLPPSTSNSKIPLHSRLLASRSMYFLQLIHQSPTPPSPTHPLTLHLPPFITSPAFESVLSYLYTLKYTPPTPTTTPTPPPQPKKEEKTLLYAVSSPTIPYTTPSLLVELYRLAMEYQLEELKVAVAKDMVGRLNRGSVWEFRRKAEECGVGMVLSMSDAFIKRNGLVEGDEGVGGGGGVGSVGGDGGAVNGGGVGNGAGGGTGPQGRVVKELRPVKRIARRFAADGSEL
ncbi:hypothetical protein HDV00_004551 [Rhizophlyctis rosea]|nr:hypothetical protein HDV00_004551 [Rhizophlyctis rosea]